APSRDAAGHYRLGSQRPSSSKRPLGGVASRVQQRRNVLASKCDPPNAKLLLMVRILVVEGLEWLIDVRGHERLNCALLDRFLESGCMLADEEERLVDQSRCLAKTDRAQGLR